MQQTRDTAQSAERSSWSTGKKAAFAVGLLLAALLGAALGIVVHYPQQVAQLTQQLMPPAADSSENEGGSGLSVEDVADTPYDPDEAPQVVTRQIAAYGDVKIYSPITQKEMTGVLFHQASYNTAVVVTTELPEANPEKVSIDHPVRVNHDQTEGDWVDADALHLYRVQDATEMDTSIDVGAKAGTTVYAPVTGTVVLVKNYDLYGYVPDVRIHIQPEGHPELDVVLLHQYDPQVKAGDKVVAGATPLSSVRDIAKDLTDVQLGFFTAADDPGNHSHVQVNNADSPGYREDSLKGAYKVKD